MGHLGGATWLFFPHANPEQVTHAHSHGHGNTNPHVNRDCNQDTNSERNPNGDSDAHALALIHANRIAFPHGDSHSVSNTNAVSFCIVQSEPHAFQHTYADCNPFCFPKPDPQLYRNAIQHPNRLPHADRNFLTHLHIHALLHSD
ncbi:MAG: hypothetical protein KatS3mg077_0173 [Candidatus Binatia bacterium]|nr:MAG: hypothetical protein KatS3mg077_0173 [Candidatus Binatia bacterium]